jgi:hypothetical protein
MSDTPPEIEARASALAAERSGGDRIRMACEMFTLGRALMFSSIRAERPDINDVGSRFSNGPTDTTAALRIASESSGACARRNDGLSG